MGQPSLRAKNGSKASFEIDHSIFAEVISLFVCDALQSLLSLHDRDSVREAFQILCKTSLIRAAMEPSCQCFRVCGRKARVLRIFCQVNHGLRTHHSVEMLMQQNLRKTPQ